MGKTVKFGGKQWSVREIGITVLSRASSPGGEGVYLYVPKDHARIYGIKPSDKVEVRLLRRYTPTTEAEQLPKVDTDLSDKNVRRQKKP